MIIESKSLKFYKNDVCLKGIVALLDEIQIAPIESRILTDICLCGRLIETLDLQVMILSYTLSN